MQQERGGEEEKVQERKAGREGGRVTAGRWGRERLQGEGESAGRGGKVRVQGEGESAGRERKGEERV